MSFVAAVSLLVRLGDGIFTLGTGYVPSATELETQLCEFVPVDTWGIVGI